MERSGLFVNTATGKIKWRGNVDRCHPETHNGSPSTEKKDRGLSSSSLGHFSQLWNTFSPSTGTWCSISSGLSFRTLDTAGFSKDILPYLFLHLGSLGFLGVYEYCSRDLQPIFKSSNIL